MLRPLAIGLGVGGLLWWTGSVSPLSVLLWTGAVFLMMVGLQQWGVRRVLADHSSSPERYPRRWPQIALPLLLVSGFQLILRKTDIFLIGMLVGAEEVGIYFAALRTAQIVTFFSFAVDAVAAPEVSRLYLLSLTGHERSSAYIFGICAALNIGLNLVGIALYGAFGAALATATSLLVRSLWIRQRVLALTGISPSVFSTLHTELSRT